MVAVALVLLLEIDAERQDSCDRIIFDSTHRESYVSIVGAEDCFVVGE